jgi:hypothetical protein
MHVCMYVALANPTHCGCARMLCDSVANPHTVFKPARMSVCVCMRVCVCVCVCVCVYACVELIICGAHGAHCMWWLLYVLMVGPRLTL